MTSDIYNFVNVTYNYHWPQLGSTNHTLFLEVEIILITYTIDLHCYSCDGTYLGIGIYTTNFIAL